MIFIIFLIAYLLVLIGIGVLHRNHASGLKSYFLGNKSGGTISITGSLLATIVGGSSTIGMAGLAYSFGVVGLWWLLVGSVGLIILSLFFVKKIYCLNVYTLPEVLEQQYGHSAVRIVASILISISWVGVISAQIIAASKIISLIWPHDVNSILIIVGIVFIIYTILGGQFSIIKTDMVQFALITSAILFVSIYGLSKNCNLDRVIQSLPHDYFSFPFSKNFDFQKVFTYFLFIGSTYMIGPDIFSRIFCAKNEGVARRSLLITSFILLIIAFSIVTIGILAKYSYPHISPETALPYYVMKMLPPIITEFMIVALIAALMSSADTCLLTTSMIITNDIVNPMMNNKLTESFILKLTRIVIIVIGFCSLIIALYIQNIISSLMLAYTLYTVGIVIPVILGFYKKILRINYMGVIFAIIISGLFALCVKLMKWNDLLPFSFLISVGTLFLGSLCYSVLSRNSLKKS